MSNLKHFAQLTVTFLIIAVIALCVNATGMLDAYQTAQATRHAAAEAQRLQAVRDLALAQADVERATGERAILEAAAANVTATTRLLDYYTRRADTWRALGLALCGLALTRLRWPRRVEENALRAAEEFPDGAI